MSAHFYIILRNRSDTVGSHDVTVPNTLHLCYIRLHLFYIGARHRPLTWSNVAEYPPSSRVVYHANTLAVSKKPKNLQGNPTFGTPPLEKESVSILGVSPKLNI